MRVRGHIDRKCAPGAGRLKKFSSQSRRPLAARKLFSLKDLRTRTRFVQKRFRTGQRVFFRPEIGFFFSNLPISLVNPPPPLGPRKRAIFLTGHSPHTRFDHRSAPRLPVLSRLPNSKSLLKTKEPLLTSAFNCASPTWETQTMSWGLKTVWLTSPYRPARQLHPESSHWTMSPRMQ